MHANNLENLGMFFTCLFLNMGTTKYFETGDSVIALRHPQRTLVVISNEKSQIRCTWILENGKRKIRKYRRADLEKRTDPDM